MSGHTFTADAMRSDVVVEGDVAQRITDVQTSTCGRCGVRVAWLPTQRAAYAPAHGLALDALVPGRPPRRCEVRHA